MLHLDSLSGKKSSHYSIQPKIKKKILDMLKMKWIAEDASKVSKFPVEQLEFAENPKNVIL